MNIWTIGKDGKSLRRVNPPSALKRETGPRTEGSTVSPFCGSAGQPIEGSFLSTVSSTVTLSTKRCPSVRSDRYFSTLTTRFCLINIGLSSSWMCQRRPLWGIETHKLWLDNSNEKSYTLKYHVHRCLPRSRGLIDTN